MFDERGIYQYISGEWFNGLTGAERAFLNYGINIERGDAFSWFSTFCVSDDAHGVEKLEHIFGDSISVFAFEGVIYFTITNPEKYLRIIHEKVFG